MNAPIRCAIVGAGVIARQHGDVLRQLGGDAELVAVIDPIAERAAAIAAEFGGVTHASLDEALAAGGIDVVVVCTPTGTHGELAEKALAAGTHVIIEKPADITPERIERIARAQEAGDRQVTVISQHRFDPATEILQGAIERGELGRISSGVAAIDWWRGQSYYDSGDWRGTWELDGGGALMNQGVHTVDLLIAALGEPVEVFGYTDTLAHERIEVEDVAVGVVRFASGALGVLHASTAVYPGLSTRLQVHGDRGSVVIENDQLRYFHATPADGATVETLMGAQDANQNQAEAVTAGIDMSAGTSVPGQMSDAHLLQYRDFIAALREGRPPRVGLRDNQRAVAVITALYESAKTGAPVPIRLGERAGAAHV